MKRKMPVAIKVKRLIRQMVDIEVREISMNDDLEYDLELDDYCIDELIMELEDYYSINLDSFYNMKSQIFTVRDFVNFVKEYV